MRESKLDQLSTVIPRSLQGRESPCQNAPTKSNWPLPGFSAMLAPGPFRGRARLFAYHLSFFLTGA